ncbi:MAG: hypothetical protein SFU86_21590 [Pirellulaceae bacterium]|nr:hypothetical protein [Pirellulaceae bacterium]
MAAAYNKVFLLRGRGRVPTAEQFALWRQIEPRLPELTQAAREAVPEPPVEKFRARFFPADLVLAEVRLERDHSIHLFFTLPLEAELELAPQVIFVDWQVTATQWVE